VEKIIAMKGCIFRPPYRFLPTIKKHKKEEKKGNNNKKSYYKLLLKTTSLYITLVNIRQTFLDN